MKPIIANLAKIMVIVLLCLASYTFSQQSPPEPENSFLLQSGRAGAFEIGMTVDEVYRLAGRDRVRLVDQFTEGMFAPALEIRLPGHKQGPTLIAPIREWPCSGFSIWGISVLDRRFRTQEGLGIGSTLGELRRHYAIGVGSYVAALKLTFELDAVGTPTDSSKVTSVWVVPQPVEVRERRCPGQGPLGEVVSPQPSAVTQRRILSKKQYSLSAGVTVSKGIKPRTRGSEFGSNKGPSSAEN